MIEPKLESQKLVGLPEGEKYDGTLTPGGRLRNLAERLESVHSTDLGVAYRTLPNGRAELVFSDLDGKQVVDIPTPISKEDFNSITKKIIPLEETKFILFELARAYKLRMPIMLEGGTAIGKTFVVNKFANMLYGPKAVIPDFYCSGQTDTSELMGKPVAATAKPEEQQQLSDYLKTDAGAALKAELIKETGGNYEYRELLARAAFDLGLPIDKAKFEFQLGTLPKAMTAQFRKDGSIIYAKDGPGVMLHIQELSLAEPSVVNCLFKVRGERGHLAKSIQLWEHDGRTIEAGPGFFMVYSTNPLGKGFLERHEIDKALARSFVWVKLPEKLSERSLRQATSSIFSFDKISPQSGTIIDLSKEAELGETFGEVMAKFHKIYQEMTERGESGRRQKIPATIDSLWRVAKLVQTVQIPTSNNKSIDMVSTLREAVKGVYTNSLQDGTELGRAEHLNQADVLNLSQSILNAFEQILANATTDLVSFRGKSVTRQEKIEILTKEAFSDESQNQPYAQAEEEAQEEAKKSAAYAGVQSSLIELKKELGEAAFSDIFKSMTHNLPEEEKEELRKEFAEGDNKV
ncbi:MAG: hypothetical protein GX589_05570 [Deltaproteobacteria bacterium]|nr:hypothetical protein [Deltaproteobacteria bacterium]